MTMNCFEMLGINFEDLNIYIYPGLFPQLSQCLETLLI